MNGLISILCLIAYVFVWFWTCVAGHYINKRANLHRVDYEQNRDCMGFFCAFWPLTIPTCLGWLLCRFLCRAAERVAGVKGGE